MFFKTVNICVVVVINLLILTVAFEILSRFFFSGYIDSKLNKIISRYQFDRDLENHSAFASDNGAKIPHPYLGYARLNKIYHFDIVNEKNQDTNDPIAIFGGSVAENFYHFNKEKKLLQENLKETFGLKSDFGIKNYALSGYKQPQQLIAAILFRPKVKMTINIEGYNEIDKKLNSRFPHYYPMSVISRLYYSGWKTWDIYIRAAKTRASQRKLKAFLEKDWGFKFVHTFFKILYFLKEKYIVDLEQELISRKRQAKKINLFGSVTFLERTIYWLERSCEQQNFLAEKGIKAYFFFQPSPYVPRSKKKLTSHEKQMIRKYKNEVQMVWEEKHHVQNVIEIFFLVRRIIKKRKLSLNLFDMSQVFLDEPQEVFRDGCCHLNQLGHSLLTQKIAEVIRKTYLEQEKPKLCHDDFRILFERFK